VVPTAEFAPPPRKTATPRGNPSPRYPNTGRRSHTLEDFSVTGPPLSAGILVRTPAFALLLLLSRFLLETLWTSETFRHHRNPYFPYLLAVSVLERFLGALSPSLSYLACVAWPLLDSDFSVFFLFVTFLQTSLSPCRAQISGLCRAMASHERSSRPISSVILGQMRS
jgi:hypothetical protein